MKIKELFDVEPITLWILGFSIMFFGLFICLKYSIEWGAIVISFAIAFFAGAISRKTERMTRDIAYSSFKETLSVMRDRRLILREKILKIEHKRKDKNYLNSKKRKLERELDDIDLNIYLSFSIWKSLEYFQRVMIFKKYLREGDEESLIHFIDNLFQDLCRGKVNCKMKIDRNYIGQLESMYDIIYKFERFHRVSIKDQNRRYRILNNLEFLKGVSNKIIFY
jgi:hypothetical protein